MGAAINSSEVILFCEKCKKATRVSHRLLENGAEARVCKKCREAF